MKQYIIYILFVLLSCFTIQVKAQDDSLLEIDDEEESELTDTEEYVRQTEDGYYFELMDIEMTVHANRTYDIVETYSTNFVEPRHGIVREIPNHFWVNRDVSEAQDSSEFELRYNGVKIENIVVSEQYTAEDGEEVKSLRIGTIDHTISGNHHYRISYKLSLPNDRVKYSDHFFHSIVGPQWTCSMDSVHFIVHFDKELPDASFDQLKIFVGPEDTENNRVFDVVDNADHHTIEGSIIELPAFWAITVDMPLPEGYFPTDDISIYYYLSWGAALLSFLCLLLLIHQEVLGDDKVASVVTFQPRKDLTSADVGSLIDGEVDNEDLLSMIPWFASHGYLSIKNQENRTILHKLKNLPSNAPEYQKQLFNGFFPKSDTFDISTASSAFGFAWEQAKKSLKKQYEGKLNDFELKGLLFLTTFLVSLTVCFNFVTPDGWIVGGIVNVLLVGMVVLMMYVRSFWKNKISFQDLNNGCSSIHLLIWMGVGLFIGAIMLLSAPLSEEDFYIPSQIPFFLMVLMICVILCQRRLLRMTDYRRERLAEIQGLREFIATAEEDRLRMLLSKNERYFYNILPYAMAFGMVSQWASKFEKLSVKEVKEFGNTPVSQISHVVNKTQWSNHIISAVSSYSSGVGSSHGSAGGHRGGYSGGGSGGGGGHSW